MISKVMRSIVGVLLLAGCASSHLRQTSLTPSDLLRTPDEFNGKVVTVVAWVTLETENANLWTSSKDMDEYEIAHCVSLWNFDSIWEQKRLLNRHKVRLTGLFRKDVDPADKIVRFDACNDAALEPISVERI